MNVFTALILSLLAPPKVLTAVPRTGPVILDGRLDEPAWRNAPIGTDFVERTPTPGRASPTPTTVRVLFDDEALYVGVRAALRAGEVPRGLELRRDNTGMFSDDALSLKIDVRHDRRTTLGFVVNPAGARLDYIALDNGRTFRREHDTVWRAATHVEGDAWTAEFRIPATALGLDAVTGDRVMGFNVTRDHNARLATDDWNPIPPEFGAMSALHFGELHGVRDMGTGTPAAFIPFVLGSWREGDGLDGSFGEDARIRLGEGIWLETTVNTDFAEVDLDDAVVNLDRFPLFRAERRPFFIAGLDVFDFGESGQAQPFFSRRIGLDANGERVPVRFGAKVYDRAGRIRSGVLAVVTDDHGGRPAALWSAARARIEVGDGHVGAILVTRHDVPILGGGAERPRHLGLGLDGRARAFDTRLELSGYGTLTANSGVDGAELEPADRLTLGTAAQVGARWRGRNFRPRAEVRHVDAHFDPQVGFVRRAGAMRSLIAPAYVWQNPTTTLARIELATQADLTTDDRLDRRLGAGAEAELEAVWTNGWAVAATARLDEDRVVNGFALADRAPVGPGRYVGPAVTLAGSSPGGRNPNANLSVQLDDGYFGGRRLGLGGGAGLSMTRHLRLTGDARYNQIDVPGAAAFGTWAFNGQLIVTPSTALAWDSVFRFDTVAEQLDAQSRLRWRWSPGSDVFLVYREQIDVARSRSTVRAVILKGTWWFDTLL